MSIKKSTKEKIVQAAWALFHDKGYENTTVEDIIAASKTSKGSFYYYFDRKDALLDTLSTIFDKEYEILGTRMCDTWNSFDKLLFINYEMHTYIDQQIPVDILASLYSTQMFSKEHSNLLDQNRVYYKLVSDIVEEGQKRDQISKEKSVREITKYYTLCERALITDWCLNKGSYSLSEYSKDYMPLMLQAFKTN